MTMRTTPYLIACALLAPLLACQPDDTEPDDTQAVYQFVLPEGVPEPKILDDRDILSSRVELGRYLFYDERLSANQTQSCASCHKQEIAFTDGRAGGLGSTGELHVRNSMSLVNVAYNTSFGWAGPAVTSLEDQAAIPLFGEFPVELGLHVMPEEEVLARFRDDARYAELFAKAYPNVETSQRISMTHIIESISDFERTLISFDSGFDRYTYGKQEDAMSDSAKRGMQLFFSERLECFHCHGGFNFSDSVDHEGLAFVQKSFHNTGLYNVDFEGAYPASDRGVYDLTGKPLDMGRFKAPTLRNIAVTAPYFHDGSAQTLDEVIAHYERGGRAILSGDNLGDGSKSPLKSELIQGFILTSDERADLIAFLESLTDDAFLSNPAFARPDDLAPPTTP